MKPFNPATDVTLECPSCRAYKTVLHPPELPAEVRLIEIICPDCDDGDFHSETWFSAPGIEISQDRESRHDPDELIAFERDIADRYNDGAIHTPAAIIDEHDGVTYDSGRTDRV